jgi:hypothetical protein
MSEMRLKSGLVDRDPYDRISSAAGVVADPQSLPRRGQAGSN